MSDIHEVGAQDVPGRDDERGAHEATPGPVPGWAQNAHAVYGALQQARQEAASTRQQLGALEAAYAALEAQQSQLAAAAETAETVIAEVLAARLVHVPGYVRPLLDGLPPGEALRWVEAHVGQWAHPVPDTDAGARGDVPPRLSVAEQAVAARLGIDPASFARHRG